MNKVSIVMPVKNGGKYIERALLSIREQTYPDWEVIVVDDQSTDNSKQIVSKFISEDSRFRYLKLLSPGGAGPARNLGIENAKGRFIAFLDCDDFWAPNKLENQISFMLSNQVAFSCSSYDIVNSSGEVIGEFHPPNFASYNDLLKSCCVGCLTAIYDQEACGKRYFPIIKKRQDYALWLELSKALGGVYSINEKLAFYRLHSSSLSSNKLKAALYQWHIYRTVERLGLIRSAYYLSNYMLRGALKHFRYRYSRTFLYLGRK